MVKQPDVHRKLTENSDAVKLLRALFDRGEVTLKSDPKSVYESDPRFYKHHPLDPFRTRLNNMKKEYRGAVGRFFYC